MEKIVGNFRNFASLCTSAGPNVSFKVDIIVLIKVHNRKSS